MPEWIETSTAMELAKREGYQFTRDTLLNWIKRWKKEDPTIAKQMSKWSPWYINKEKFLERLDG